MPDFERSPSASFISSNEGETPLPLNRLSMNSSNSYCFLVNMRPSRRRPAASFSCGPDRSRPRSPCAAFDYRHQIWNKTKTLRYVLVWFRLGVKVSRTWSGSSSTSRDDLVIVEGHEDDS